MNYKIPVFLVSLSIIIKVIAIHYTAFDLFGDEAQYWLWSINPDLGYYSKPPLLAWFIKLHTLIFGNSFAALKYFPLIFYFFTSYVIYLLSYELYQKKEIAVISSVSFYLLPSVSISSFLISTDVLLLFLCSSLLLILLKIRKKPNINNFAILGIFFGLAFLTKYAAVYYFLSLILIIILDYKIRNAFFKNYINYFVFLICFIVVIFPNILWNIKNEWITLFHTSDNAGLERISLNVYQGLEFLLSQSAMLGPLLFFSFFLYFKKININFQSKFLLAFSLPVFFIVFVESILVRANANWAAVGLIPLFLLMIEQIYTHSKKIIIYNNIINFVFCFIFFFLIATSSNLKIFDRISGVSNFTNIFKDNYLKTTKTLVVEDRLLFSSMYYYLRKHDATLLTPYNPSNKIKSHFHLSRPLKKEHGDNFIFIGNLKSLEYLEKEFHILKKEEKSVKFFNSKLEVYEIFF